MQSVDWSVIAALVQAVGSVGAIFAAIYIGNRQHDQNVDLVEKERARIREEDQKARRQTASEFRLLLDMVFNAKRETLDRLIEKIRGLDQSQEPFEDEVRMALLAYLTMAKLARGQWELAKPVFMTSPYFAIRYAQITTNFDLLTEHCQMELNRNERRINGDVGIAVQARFILMHADQLYTAINWGDDV